MAIASDYSFGVNGGSAKARPQTRKTQLTAKNVEGAERWASIGGGGALTWWGVRKGGILGTAAALLGAGLVARGVTQRCPVKATFAATADERDLAKAHGWASAAIVTRAVTVNRPRSELYAFWRDFSNLARFMENVEEVKILDDKRSHWRVKGPIGALEWESLILEDQPDKRIAWEASPGADVSNAGWVEFADAPRGRGTQVRALIVYEPPAGKLGVLAAKALRKEPAIQARRDLKRFKQLMETGEVATSQPPHAAPRASNH